MTLQRKIRIEVVVEHRDQTGEYQRTDTIAAVEVELPAGMEVPGERLIEGARLAYRHVVGTDLTQLIVEGEQR